MRIILPILRDKITFAYHQRGGQPQMQESGARYLKVVYKVENQGGELSEIIAFLGTGIFDVNRNPRFRDPSHEFSVFLLGDILHDETVKFYVKLIDVSDAASPFRRVLILDDISAQVRLAEIELEAEPMDPDGLVDDLHIIMG